MRSIVFLAVIIGLSASAWGQTPTPALTLDEKAMGWHHESEIGYIVVGGNTRSQSFSGKQTTSYQWKQDIAKLSGHYLSARAKDQTSGLTETTAENWSAVGRWEHLYIPNKVGLYLQAGVSGDRFIGVDFAQAYDVGVKYFWISSESFKFFSELGYRYLNEELESVGITRDDLQSNFIRIFNQFEYMHSESVKMGLWVEYLPDIENEDNYRVNFSPYLLTILSDTFSLKFAYEGTYRSIPVAPNTERLDYRHTTALIAKF